MKGLRNGAGLHPRFLATLLLKYLEARTAHLTQVVAHTGFNNATASCLMVERKIRAIDFCEPIHKQIF